MVRNNLATASTQQTGSSLERALWRRRAAVTKGNVARLDQRRPLRFPRRYCREPWRRPTHEIYTMSSLNAARAQVRRAAALLQNDSRLPERQMPGTLFTCAFSHSSSREPDGLVLHGSCPFSPFSIRRRRSYFLSHSLYLSLPDTKTWMRCGACSRWDII